MTNPQTSSPSVRNGSIGKIAGGFLVACAILIIFTMGHHPTGLGGGSVVAGLSQTALVHSAMIGFVIANLWGFAIYQKRTRSDGFALAGIIAYAMSAVGNAIAATISGAVTPGLAARVDVVTNNDLFTLEWMLHQSFAALAVYLVALAYALWGIGLLHGGKGLNRMLGLVGLACGVVPALALLAGWLALDVHGAFVIYAAHSLFAALVGVQMLRGKL